MNAIGESVAQLDGEHSMGISGIPSQSLSEQVAMLEYKLNYINTLAGELIATCIANLDRGTITSGPEFREYVEIRSSMRMQVMGEFGGVFRGATPVTLNLRMACSRCHSLHCMVRHFKFHYPASTWRCFVRIFYIQNEPPQISN